jgi:hypothetical protein
MPSGKIHLQIWKHNAILSVGIACASVIMFESVAPLAFIPGYGIGFFIDPDLDQDGVTAAEYRMMRYMGDVGAFIVGYFMWYGDWSQFELFFQPWFSWMFFGNWFSDLLHIAADYGYLPRLLRGQ